MPIYAYRCSSCGHAKDVLQKMSDPLLVVCPACGASTFTKQLTAAGFQLKGSGWYVTDFRGGNNKPGTEPDDASKPDAPAADAPTPGSTGDAAKNDGAKSEPVSAPPAASAPAPASASASTPASAAVKPDGK